MFDKKKLYQCYQATKNQKSSQYKPAHSRKNSKYNHKQTAIRHIISNQTDDAQENNYKKADNNSQKQTFGHKNVTKVQDEGNQYRTMTKKLFDYLDIEKKGYIDKMCLNLKIPNSILYFFGSIFRQLKQQNKKFTAQQFLNECLLKQQNFNQEQVATFYEDMKKFNLNVSYHPLSYSCRKPNNQDKKLQQSLKINWNNNTNNKLRNSLRRSGIKNLSKIQIPKPQSARKSQNYRNMMALKQQQINKLKLQPKTARDSKRDLSTYTFYPVQQKKVQLKLLSQIDQNRPIQSKKIPFDLSKKNEGKLDELTMKIQDYIKKNADRLQFSKGLRKNIMCQAII